MRVIVGGVSEVHDALLAAALRRFDVDAEPLVTPDASCLASGRALLTRGHCNPTYYLAGALVEHLREAARREGSSPEQVGSRYAYLTAGSCGPCRFATYAAEYRRALTAAGFGDVAGAVIDPANPTGSADLESMGIRVTGRFLRSLAGAALLGDVLVRAGCAHRARTGDASTVDGLLGDARATLEARLASGEPVVPVLGGLGERLRALPDAEQPVSLRVRVTGQFFASITDGDGGYHIVRELERHRVAVEPPAVAEWLLYLAWQARQPRIYPAGPDESGSAVDWPAMGRHAARIDAAIRGQYARYAVAAAVDAGALPDMDDLQRLAEPHYRPELRGGMSHLEVAHLLRADRDRRAELVVSIKPFGCLPSSAVSDGIARALERRETRTAFVSIETTGDAHTMAESRLELALDRGRDRSS